MRDDLSQIGFDLELLQRMVSGLVSFLFCQILYLFSFYWQEGILQFYICQIILLFSFYGRL